MLPRCILFLAPDKKGSTISFFSTAPIINNDNLTCNQLLNNVIPSEFIHTKDEPIFVYLDYIDDISYFVRSIRCSVPINRNYTVFVKVRYDMDRFAMTGNQFAFNYFHLRDIELMFETIVFKLEQHYSLYSTSQDDIEYVQLVFRVRDEILLSEFALVKPKHVPKKENEIVVNKLSIPVSINQKSLGNALAVDISENIITNIILSIHNKEINFLEVIKESAKLLRANHQDNITKFYKNFIYLMINTVTY